MGSIRERWLKLRTRGDWCFSITVMLALIVALALIWYVTDKF